MWGILPSRVYLVSVLFHTFYSVLKANSTNDVAPKKNTNETLKFHWCTNGTCWN